MTGDSLQSLAPVDPGSLSFALSFLYMALALLCCVQLGRFAYHRVRLLAFGPVFTALALVWTLVRAVQLLLVRLLDRTTWAEQAVDLVPTLLEFGTFSLLAAFFAYVLFVERLAWEARRCLVMSLYTCANVFVWALNGVLLGFYVHTDASVLPTWIAQLELAVEGVMWLIVVCVLGASGFSVWRMLGHRDAQVALLLPKGSNRCKLGVLLTIIMVAYSSRVVFSFVSLGTHQFYAVHNGIGSGAIVVFVLLVAWEVVPLTAVLVLFGSMSSSRAPLTAPLVAATPNLSINDTGIADTSSVAVEAPAVETDPLLVSSHASFFANTSRYDSDPDQIDELGSSADNKSFGEGARAKLCALRTAHPSQRPLRIDPSQQVLRRACGRFSRPLFIRPLRKRANIPE